MPLTPADCPLTTPEIVGLYNRLDAVAARAEKELPRLWAALAAPDTNPEALPPVPVRIGSLESVLRRLRYRVGFLGRSQVGKSTTFNNVLGVKKEDSPSKEGRGEPTTSAVTRLFRVAPGSPPICRLWFMNRLQYQQRRNDLCRTNGLPEVPIDAAKDHRSLAQENDSLLGQVESLAAAAVASADLTIKHRRRYFARLLKSFNKFGERLVKPEAVQAPGEYARRADYANHPDGDAVSEYLLLREVEIGFPTDKIDDKLEMIDLPGLGSQNVEDDSLTLAYLPTLDGGLLFQSTEQVASIEVIRLLGEFRREFRSDLTNRVWMVITRFDGLGQTTLYGDEASPATVFDSLDRTLRDGGLPHNQVLFVGNEFYKTFLAAQATSPGPLPAERVCDLLKLRLTPDGAIDLPSALERYPVLRDAYNRVVENGGVPWVREVIAKTLYAAVQKKVQEDARREIREVATILQNRVVAGREQSAMNIDQITAAAQWEAAVQAAADQIEEKRVTEELARGLGKTLRGLFNTLCGPAMRASLDALVQRHTDQFAPLLRTRGMVEVKAEVWPKIVQKVVGILEDLGQKGLTPLNLPGTGSPADTLRKALEKDTVTEWLGPVFDSIVTVPLFGPEKRRQPADPGFAPNLSIDEYRKIMTGKLDAVIGEVAHTIAGRLRERLEDLQRQLGWLGNVGANDAPGDTATYDDLIRELEGIINDAR